MFLRVGRAHDNRRCVFGLARNKRLAARLQPALDRAEARSRESGEPARLFTEFRYRTLNTWSRQRRFTRRSALDLFADRTSTATMRANQLRLWFASMAYVLLSALRRALAGTRLAKATCGSIRLKLLKIGAQVRRSARRIRIAMASACPHADIFARPRRP